MRTQSPPKISWLMPLNSAEEPEYLRLTLKSLEDQTLKADELIIAGDGSLPNELLNIITDSSLPWVLYDQPQKRGIGATLAMAADYCRGRIIIRIDSDDIYSAEHTELIVNELMANPSLGAVGSQLAEFDSDSGICQSNRSAPISSESARAWLPWRNPLNHQTVGITRDALINAGGYRDCPAFEDWDLWLRIAAKGHEIRSIAACTVSARVGSNHLERRRGLSYAFKEYRFYMLQAREGRIRRSTALLACTIRLPWRVLPSIFMQWWMRSNARKSPAVRSTRITQSTPKRTRHQSKWQEQKGGNSD